jgi:hypothetical protein
MRLPNNELRTFVYNRLNGAITYLTRVVEVDSLPASDTAFSYIHLSTITTTESGTKDNYATRSNFDIEIVQQQIDELANYAEIESVANDVIDRLVDYISDTPNFNIVWCHFISAIESEELSDTGRTLTNRITFEYYLTEL